MGSWQFFSLRKLNFGVLSLTAFLVLVLLGFVLGPAFRVPSELAENSLKFERAPASLPTSSPQILAQVHATLVRGRSTYEIVDLSCFQNGFVQSIKTSANQVRLRGRSCGGKLKLGGSLITNETTGREATVFDVEKTQFSTDVVRLVDGKNNIRVILEKESGQRLVAQISIEKTQGL